MKLRDIMSGSVVRINPEESVAVAARILARCNVGMLPVCGGDGRLYGVVTDRDLVTRCVAANRAPNATPVREVMSANVISATADMDASSAAQLMARMQIRRLPVVENGRLCGLVSLADLAGREETVSDAAEALSGISSNVSVRG